MLIKLDQTQEEVIQDFIHKNLAKSCGLMSHEYKVFFDPQLSYNGTVVDYVISAGPVVHVALRCNPATDRMVYLCKIVFNQSLRTFLRVNLASGPEMNAWRAKAVKLEEEHLEKKIRRKEIMRAMERRTISSVELKHKKTKKVVIAEVYNGDIFEAQERALKELFGASYAPD